MEKRYYINNLVKVLGISRKTYYNWEKGGKIRKAKRDKINNYRYWTVADISKLMIKTRGTAAMHSKTLKILKEISNRERGKWIQSNLYDYRAVEKWFKARGIDLGLRRGEEDRKDLN